MTHEPAQTPSAQTPSSGVRDRGTDYHAAMASMAAGDMADLSVKSPRQLIVIMVLAFCIPVVAIMLLANWASSRPKTGAGSAAFTPEAISQRIAPVAGFVLVDANAPKVYKTGEQIFQTVCTACHTAGVAGAPKLGDTAAWAPRLQTGFEALLATVLHGKGAMPPKGGNPALSDYEIARAVVYMANKSGGNLPEPQEPAKYNK